VVDRKLHRQLEIFSGATTTLNHNCGLEAPKHLVQTIKYLVISSNKYGSSFPVFSCMS